MSSEARGADMEAIRRAANPQTANHILRGMAFGCGDEFVLVYVSENSNTPADALEMLSHHPCPEVRIGVADNRAASEEIITRLVFDESVDVRYSVAENHNTPNHLLEILAEDQNPWVAHRAQRTIARLLEEAGSEQPQSEEQASREDSGPVTVMIADDNNFIRSIIRRNLDASSDVKVVAEAANGAEAIDFARRYAPDVVLMDINMPNIDGVEAAREIKANYPDTRVVMVTGSDSDDDITDAFQAGADGYFLKSSAFGNLANCVCQVAGGANWIDPGITSLVLRKCFTGTSKVSESSTGEFDALRLLHREIDELESARHYEEAKAVCKVAIELATKLYGEKSLETMTAIARLAEIHIDEKDYENSQTLLVGALTDHQELLNDADAETDSVINFLGRAAESTGNRQQAELYYSWSLRIRERLQDKEKILEAEEQLDRLLKS